MIPDDFDSSPDPNMSQSSGPMPEMQAGLTPASTSELYDPKETPAVNHPGGSAQAT